VPLVASAEQGGGGERECSLGEGGGDDVGLLSAQQRV